MRLLAMIACFMLLAASPVLPAFAKEAAQTEGGQAEKTTESGKDTKKTKKTDASLQAYREREKQRQAAKEKGLQMRRNTQEQGK